MDNLWNLWTIYRWFTVLFFLDQPLVTWKKPRPPGSPWVTKRMAVMVTAQEAAWMSWMSIRPPEEYMEYIYGIYIYIIHIVIYMEYMEYMDLPFLVICYIAIEKLP